MFFIVHDSEITHISTVLIETDTGDHPPVYKKMKKTPLVSRYVNEKVVENKLRDEIIFRMFSEWSPQLLY